MYNKSNGKRSTDWFVDAGYGLFVHWTCESQPATGRKKSYQEAVDSFDVNKFVSQVEEAGAKYLFFTISHVHMYLPFSCERVNAILPGRTCSRDLCEELYQALNAKGIKMMFYYNADGVKDDEWMNVTCFKTDIAKHANLTYEIINGISQKYGDKVSGWWIDGCYDRNYYLEYGIRYDYVKYADALRAGNPNSIIAFNFKGTGVWDSDTGKGIADYQAGEENDLERLPNSRYSGEGNTQWHALCWMDEFWVHEKQGMPVPRYNDEEVIQYIKSVMQKQGVFSYNTAIYQEGYISEPVMQQLRAIRKAIRG